MKDVDTWDLMCHWHLVLPPSRPSALQIERIRARMDAIPRDLPVAILGSTPEFRDLLHESGFREIFVFERNSAFYDAMSRSRVHDNQEMFVQGDWTTTLSQHRGKFAVILSDLTSGNVPYEQRAKFYADLESALLVGGVFCDKVLTHSIPTLAIAPLSEKYERLPLNLVHINHFSSEMLFCSELIDLEQMVDTTNFYRILERRLQGARLQAFLSHAKRITPPGCFWWYGRKWSELQADYCPNLAQLSVTEDEPTSPYQGFVKFFDFARTH